MINRKINMDYEEYGYFIDIETNTIHNFPDNLKSMNKKYKISSIDRYSYKFNKLNLNVNVNIMTTIPEINENSSHSNISGHKKKKCSYDKITMFVLILIVVCFKCFYFLHNFV